MQEQRRHRLESLGIWLAVAISLVVSALPVIAPNAPTARTTGGFSVDRAIGHVEAIAQEPHVMGTPEIERVRSYLTGTLAENGLPPETQTVEAPDYYGRPGSTVEITNVLTRIEGSAGGDDAILFMAHYDTVATTPGANDNAAAVAALLEVGSVLVMSQPDTDVILLFTDGEEPTPRYGASAFVEEHPWSDDVFLAVNFEGIGVGGPSMLVELEGSPSELIPRLANATPDPVAFSFVTGIADLIGGAASDFDVFREAGIPGYNFAYLRGSSIYHTPRDSVDALNVDGMAHHGALALGLARYVGIPEVQGGDESVFLTIPSGFLVRYPATGALILAAVAAGLAVLMLWARRSAGASSGRSLAAGTGLVLLALTAALVVGAITWTVVVGARPEMTVLEGYAWLAALIAVTGSAWWAAVWRSGRTGSDVVGGLVVVWIVPASLLGLLLPVIGYLFVVPLLMAGIVCIFGRRVGGYAWRLTLVVIVSLTTFVILTPAVDTIFHFASPRPGNPDSELPWMIVIPLLMAFLAVGLVTSEIGRGRRR